MKRETNAWAVAQEAEIERLNMEAAECRTLYEVELKMNNCSSHAYGHSLIHDNLTNWTVMCIARLRIFADLLQASSKMIQDLHTQIATMVSADV